MRTLLNYPGAKRGMAQETEFIARISYGKDSLKMLQVIKSRGLPLDRITTTDVWATDTISANLPPMAAFKDRMDEKIWDMYRIEVEHLCALNKDGSKRTYEQMFYHIPNRKNRGGTAREQFSDSQISGTRGVKLDSNGTPMHRVQGNITGFPPNTGYNWCQKLKSRVPGSDFPMVPEAQDRQGQNPFLPERTTRRRDRNIVEYLGIAADEPARFGQLNARKRAPLVEFGIDEDLCGLYCQYNDMLAPTYESFSVAILYLQQFWVIVDVANDFNIFW